MGFDEKAPELSGERGGRWVVFTVLPVVSGCFEGRNSDLALAFGFLLGSSSCTKSENSVRRGTFELLLA